MKHILTIACLALFLPIGGTPTLADEIHLKTGAVFTGRVVEEGDTIIIDLPAGRLTVPSDQVEAIIPGRTPLHDYQDKRAAIADSTQASDFFSLAFWAKSNDLSQYVRPLLKHTIALDPHHLQARTLLGYFFHEGQWLTKSQYLIAQGLVRYRGKWMKAQERDAILARILERREERRQKRQDRLLALRDQQAQRAWNRKYSGNSKSYGSSYYGSSNYGSSYYGSSFGSSFRRRSALYGLGWQAPYSGLYYKTCSPFGYPSAFYKKLIITIP